MGYLTEKSQLEVYCSMRICPDSETESPPPSFSLSPVSTFDCDKFYALVILFECDGFDLSIGSEPILNTFIDAQHLQVHAGSRGRMRCYMAKIFGFCYLDRDLYTAAGDDKQMKLNFFRRVSARTMLFSKTIEPEVLMQLVEVYSRGRRSKVEQCRRTGAPLLIDYNGDDNNLSSKYLVVDSDNEREEDLVVKHSHVMMAVEGAKQLYIEVDRWNDWLDEHKHEHEHKKAADEHKAAKKQKKLAKRLEKATEKLEKATEALKKATEELKKAAKEMKGVQVDPTLFAQMTIQDPKEQ
ncbi:hypothetical protein F4820DRAFT_449771 [Hypoxylon rubiginosum]|uniref:Uncharacterized protein n=1 Tax=Hypoxylon rubiginosum TaxID=110542 RepID=A0ACB9YWI4_9PEZI|nr:hypothetical protein F4820DRAFT_449771 [Hypoxylon rubiginosum]